jgi:hypothetical protein
VALLLENPSKVTAFSQQKAQSSLSSPAKTSASHSRASSQASSLHSSPSQASKISSSRRSASPFQAFKGQSSSQFKAGINNILNKAMEALKIDPKHERYDEVFL